MTADRHDRRVRSCLQFARLSSLLLLLHDQPEVLQLALGLAVFALGAATLGAQQRRLLGVRTRTTGGGAFAGGHDVAVVVELFELQGARAAAVLRRRTGRGRTAGRLRLRLSGIVVRGAFGGLLTAD